MNRCIANLTLDDVINATEQDQVCNIVDTQFIKYTGFIGRNGFEMNRCIANLTLDDVINATEQDQVCNIVDAQFIKYTGFIGRNGFIANVQ